MTTSPPPPLVVKAPAALQEAKAALEKDFAAAQAWAKEAQGIAQALAQAQAAEFEARGSRAGTAQKRAAAIAQARDLQSVLAGDQAHHEKAQGELTEALRTSLLAANRLYQEAFGRERHRRLEQRKAELLANAEAAAGYSLLRSVLCWNAAVIGIVLLLIAILCQNPIPAPHDARQSRPRSRIIGGYTIRCRNDMIAAMYAVPSGPFGFT